MKSPIRYHQVLDFMRKEQGVRIVLGQRREIFGYKSMPPNHSFQMKALEGGNQYRQGFSLWYGEKGTQPQGVGIKWKVK